MLLGRQNATTGGSGNNLASVSLFQFLSNDDGQCVKFSLKRGGKWEQGGPVFFIFFSLYSRRSFLLISLAFENPLSITLSLYPRLFKWWRKSHSLCLVVSTVEYIRFTLIAWLDGIKNRVPLVLTYHPSLEKISRIVRHHWKEIEKSETLAKLFPEPPVVAFRRPKSIKDTLVRGAVSRPSLTVGQCKPCGDKRCKCSLQLQHAQVVHSKTTGKEYKIFCNVNCKTHNVVYLPDCHVCGSQYVGESVQPFNKRMNRHNRDLAKKTLLPWVNTLCRRGTRWITLAYQN
jgi:hypothetical protein